MDPIEIAKLIELATTVLASGIKLFNDAQATMSETDIAAIKANLATAQALTDAYRTQADAALDDAAKQ